jgi:hypothetical protein
MLILVKPDLLHWDRTEADAVENGRIRLQPEITLRRIQEAGILGRVHHWIHDIERLNRN